MLVICEKPSLAEAIHSSTKINFDSFFNNSFMYEFDYTNYDYKGTPNYKIRDGMKTIYKHIIFDKGNLINLGRSLLHSEKELDKLTFLSNFNEICFVVENDYSSVRSFDLLFNKFVDIDENLPITFMFIKEGFETISSGFKERKSCNKKSLNDYKINSYREAYMLKDYIDYHFSYLLFSKFGIKLTRNMIWALALQYQLDKQNPVSCTKLIRRFSERDLGTVASRQAIILGLTRYDFLKKSEANDTYTLTDSALLLIEKYNNVLFREEYFKNFVRLFKNLNNGGKKHSFEGLKSTVDDYLNCLAKELDLDMAV